jgi:hypothetical protein
MNVFSQPAAAVFDLWPAMGMVSESGETLPMCVVMATYPPQANIANEVVVYLETEDGTGTGLTQRL